MALQCRACGGVYEPEQAGGMLYFHVCPPLSLAELESAVETSAVVLPADETPEIAHSRRFYQRADRRDENVSTDRDAREGAIKAEGAGVIEVVSRDRGPFIVDTGKPRV